MHVEDFSSYLLSEGVHGCETLSGIFALLKCRLVSDEQCVLASTCVVSIRGMLFCTSIFLFRIVLLSLDVTFCMNHYFSKGRHWSLRERILEVSHQ